MSRTNDWDDSLTPLCHIVTPVGMLGYGFDEQQTSDVLKSLVTTNIPTAIILDSGSTDSGPSKLALGSLTSPRSSYVRDLEKLLELVDTFKVPLIFSSAGGDGSNEHVMEMVQIIEEIAAQEKNRQYRFKTIALFSAVEKALVLDRLRAGAVRGCGKNVPQLTEADVESSPRILGQMGPEPFVDAMKANPDFDIIVGGRSYDPAPFIAFATFVSKLDPETTDETALQRILGGFAHMGKVMECGGVCAEPKSVGAIATVYRNATFDITPMDPAARCTPISVAAHSLYENVRPDFLYGPGGCMDLTKASYKQLSDGRTVRASGTLFNFSRSIGLPYQLKLEAASIIGYRTMYMGSIKDEILIGSLDSLLHRVKDYVATQHRNVTGSWEFDVHIYGEQSNDSSEVFLIGEALASSQQLATSVASTARVATMHGSYHGQKATAGNFAFGIGGKTEIELGPCPKFSIYHLMDLNPGEERLVADSKVDEMSTHDSGHSVSAPIFLQAVSIIGRGEYQEGRQQLAETPVDVETQWVSKVSEGPVCGVSPGQDGHPPPTKLGHLARVLRSKNAGPYEITFDILFESRLVYDLVKQTDMLNLKTVSNVLNVSEEDVTWSGFFDPAQAYKVTIPRIRAGKKVAAGSFMEDDVHGSQQHRGIFDIELPVSILTGLMELKGM